MKLRLLLCTIAAILVALAPGSSRACRFNIRDVGFTELRPTPYRLFLYVHDSATSEARALNRAAQAALIESNVRPETIDLAATPDHAANAYMPPSGAVLPTAALVHRSGRSMSIPLPHVSAGDDPDKVWWPALRQVLESPLRTKFLDQVDKTFAAVLLVESIDEAKNREARDAALAAVADIRTRLPLMAKPLDVPPRLMTVPFEQRDAERVVLWSMGIVGPEVTDPGPAAVVLYGRGRRVGPTLSGEDLTQENLSRILSVVGADCECGLDRAWMEGDTLPLAWTVETRNRVAQALGFDPENPLVKTEMSQILSQGVSTGRSIESVFRDAPLTFLGYSEQVISFEPREPSEETLSPAELRAQMIGASDGGLERAAPETSDAFTTPTEAAPAPTTPPRPAVAAAPHDSAVEPRPGALSPAMRRAMLIVGLLILAVVAAGVVILLKARGRTR